LNISQCLGLEQVFPPDLSNREQSYFELETARCLVAHFSIWCHGTAKYRFYAIAILYYITQNSCLNKWLYL